MRIGFVLYGDLTTRTGGFLYDRMLLKGLSLLGVEVELIQLPWRNYSISLLESLAGLATQRLYNREVDLLIQDELAHPSLFRINRSIKKRLGLPLVALVHHLRSSEDHPRTLKWIYRQVEKVYMDTVDGIIANSPATLLAAQTMVDRDLPSVVAPPGRGHFKEELSEDKIQARAEQQSALEILFLGSVIPRKRLDDLIAALSMTQDLDFKLTVIGGDQSAKSHVRKIKSLIETKGLTDHVRWLGEQPDAQVKCALETAHLLIVPSSHEGFGIAYLDAMGYGVIPIGTTSGGAASIIHNTLNGFLIDPGDRKSLTRYITDLAEDRELLTRMALNAYRRYQQQPTWEKVAGIVHDYLEANFKNDPARLAL